MGNYSLVEVVHNLAVVGRIPVIVGVGHTAIAIDKVRSGTDQRQLQLQ